MNLNGRGGGIRTRDPLHPMQVRYQAALRPDSRIENIHYFFYVCKKSAIFSRFEIISSSSPISAITASREIFNSAGAPGS